MDHLNAMDVGRIDADAPEAGRMIDVSASRARPLAICTSSGAARLWRICKGQDCTGRGTEERLNYMGCFRFLFDCS